MTDQVREAKREERESVSRALRRIESQITARRLPGVENPDDVLLLDLISCVEILNARWE